MQNKYFDNFGRNENTEFFYSEKSLYKGGIKFSQDFNYYIGKFNEASIRIEEFVNSKLDFRIENKYLTTNQIRDFYGLMEQINFKNKNG